VKLEKCQKQERETAMLTVDKVVLRPFTVSIQDVWCKLRARRRSISVDICMSLFPINRTYVCDTQQINGTDIAIASLHDVETVTI